LSSCTGTPINITGEFIGSLEYSDENSLNKSIERLERYTLPSMTPILEEDVIEVDEPSI
jgi:hypothetical protein